MIIKPLVVPVHLLQMEALNLRLPVSHTQKDKVASRARNLRAGYNGELSLQFPLSFLPDEKYLIFHNLRIPDPQGCFEIDILLLSTNFILIVEVKNIWDHVIFDGMGQSFRIEDDKEQAFTNPVDQVKLQHLRLQRWLRQLNLPLIPIENIVAYSNPMTILKNITNDKEIAKTVIHKEQLLEKIDKFSSKHNLIRLSETQLFELSHNLLSAHTAYRSNILNKYKVSCDRLIKGVFCPGCSRAPMVRKGGKWLCNSCGHSSRTAHKAALRDYALLVNKYISNSEGREFLQLESPYITKQLLQKEKLKYFGVKSGRKYILSIDHLV